MGVQFHDARKEIEMDGSVILDAKATFSSFKTKELLTDIGPEKNETRVSMNVRSRVIMNTGKVPGCEGKIWHDPSGVTNIFGFSEPVENTNMTCDNKKEDAFMVKMNGKEVKFPRSEDGSHFMSFQRLMNPLLKQKMTCQLDQCHCPW